jgi:hypothetical protein
MGMFDGISLRGRERGGGSPDDSSTLAAVERLLQEIGLRYEVLQTGSLRLLFSLPDDRAQQLVIQDAGELGGLPILNIVSPVADLSEHAMNPEAAIKLLEASGQLKVGGFFVGGTTLLFGYTAFLANLDAQVLETLCLVVAQTADEAEGDLTGADVF